jgi:hypothetical protein
MCPQGTPEPDMAFRLLKYLTRLWDLIEQQQKKPKSKLRPPILPLVLHLLHAAATDRLSTFMST